jgi:RimJ/RimL family protein N-acetyltransferase
MRKQYLETGFTYFAVDRLDANEFIGFIGLSRQSYEAPFTPCVDIGWRLVPSAWQSGYATEGAMRCLQYATNELQLDAVYAVAPKVNKRSERVMIKAGMEKVTEFNHPLLAGHAVLNPCVVYKQS